MSPLTGVLTEAWQLYRRYAAHFLVISFVIFLVAAIIEALLTSFAGAAGYVLAAIVSYIALFLVEAALVTAVQDVRDGRVDLDFGQTVSAALPFLGSVALASVLASIGIAIGFVLLIVPGLILLTFWSLIVPSIVVGRAGALDSFGRSWRMVRGHAWNVFGTYVLVFLIWIAVSIVLGLILLAVPTLARNFVSNLVASTLMTPFLAIVVTLIYFRLTDARAGQPAPAGPGYGQPAAPGYGQPAGSGQPAEPGYQPPPGGGWTAPATPAGAGGSEPPPAPPPAGGWPGPQAPPAAPPPAEGGTTGPQQTSPAPPAGGGWTEPQAPQPPAGGFTQPYPVPGQPPPDDVTEQQVPAEPPPRDPREPGTS
jgi:hypothetical protein